MMHGSGLMNPEEKNMMTAQCASIGEDTSSGSATVATSKMTSSGNTLENPFTEVRSDILTIDLDADTPPDKQIIKRKT